VEAIGIGLGIRAGQVHDWWEGLMSSGQIMQRMPASLYNAMNAAGARSVDMSELVDMYMAAGGTAGDAGTNMRLWAQVLNQFEKSGRATPYFDPSRMHFSPAMPVSPRAGYLSTPGASRPVSGAGTGAKPTAALTGGHRVQIGQIGPIYSGATDAKGLMADIDRAAQRKFLVAQADPGMA